jgi:hypothetical protein
MDSYQKNLKDRSPEKNNGSSPKTFKRTKHDDNASPDKINRLVERERPMA